MDRALSLPLVAAAFRLGQHVHGHHLQQAAQIKSGGLEGRLAEPEQLDDLRGREVGW